MKKLLLQLMIVATLCVPATAQEFSLVSGTTKARVQQQANTAVPAFAATQEEEHDDSDLPITPPQIIGGGNYEIGDLIELSIKNSSEPENLHSVTYSWSAVPDIKATEWPDGSKLLFGTGKVPRKIDVIVTASYVFVEKNENNEILDVSQGALTVRTVVTIGQGGGGGGTTNLPPADPVLPVDPLPTDPLPTDPVLPLEPTFSNSLAQSSYDWAKQVTTFDKAGDAQKLSSNFLTVQQEIQAGKFTGRSAVAKIFERVKSLNDSGLSDSKTDWKPWLDSMAQHLQAAYNNGEIKTPEQFAVAWGQIAEGLSVVK